MKQREREGRERSADARDDGAATDDLFELVAPPTAGAARVDGVSIGTFRGLDAAGVPLVDYPENRSGEPVPARATGVPGAEDAGREVALLFEGGDPRRPILIGCLQRASGAEAHAPGLVPDATPRDVTIDGERLVLDAKREIVLRCGKATITLTRAGKILIRGAYLSSRSSGVNRVKGGSVQIN